MCCLPSLFPCALGHRNLSKALHTWALGTGNLAEGTCPTVSGQGICPVVAQWPALPPCPVPPDPTTQRDLTKSLSQDLWGFQEEQHREEGGAWAGRAPSPLPFLGGGQGDRNVFGRGTLARDQRIKDERPGLRQVAVLWRPQRSSSWCLLRLTQNTLPPLPHPFLLQPCRAASPGERLWGEPR